MEGEGGVSESAARQGKDVGKDGTRLADQTPKEFFIASLTKRGIPDERRM